MQIFKKMHACEAASGGPLLGISRIPLLSVMTLLSYTISNFKS